MPKLYWVMLLTSISKGPYEVARYINVDLLGCYRAYKHVKQHLGLMLIQKDTKFFENQEYYRVME